MTEGHADITLVKGAVHNPSDPRHFMRIVPATRRWVASIGDHNLADSTGATIVKEVGRDIYDPVAYFPRADIDMSALVSIDKSTHCPVKGSTEYFDIVIGDQTIGEAAWSYVDSIVAGAEALDGLIAFDPAKVTIR